MQHNTHRTEGWADAQPTPQNFTSTQAQPIGQFAPPNSSAQGKHTRTGSNSHIGYRQDTQTTNHFNKQANDYRLPAFGGAPQSKSQSPSEAAAPTTASKDFVPSTAIDHSQQQAQPHHQQQSYINGIQNAALAQIQQPQFQPRQNQQLYQTSTQAGVSTTQQQQTQKQQQHQSSGSHVQNMPHLHHHQQRTTAPDQQQSSYQATSAYTPGGQSQPQLLQQPSQQTQQQQSFYPQQQPPHQMIQNPNGGPSLHQGPSQPFIPSPQVRYHHNQQPGGGGNNRGGQSPSYAVKDHCRGYDTRNISMQQTVMFLDLFTFKIEQCQQDPQNHNLKRCPFYHDYYKDRRRPLGTYQSEICPQMTGKGTTCQRGDMCDRAHNRVEEFYHPDKYKAKFCSSYLEPNGQPCEYLEFCSFAHNDSELSIELIEKFDVDMDFYMFHFKTVWCPYREDDHDRKICVYAHNWQDYRRRPSVFLYSSKMCPQWQVNNFISSYSEGCANQYQCLYSHGWKEQEYHPDFLKVKPCQHAASCKKSHCPYYHSEHDRQLPLAQWFRFFPKTRIASFQSNFYMASYGTQQSFMANKQTCFSSLSTLVICNQARLNQGRGHSPDSNMSTASHSNNILGSNQRGYNKPISLRSTGSSGQKQFTDNGSQNSNNKRQNKRQGGGHSKHSQNSAGSYQIQAHHQSSSQKQSQHSNQQSWSNNMNDSASKMSQHALSNGPQQSAMGQRYQKKNQVDAQVKFSQPMIVNNHFRNSTSVYSGGPESGGDQNQSQGLPNYIDVKNLPQSPEIGAVNHASLQGQLVDSPLKPSLLTRSDQSLSISGKDGSYSGSANYSGSSVNMPFSALQTGNDNRGSSFVQPMHQQYKLTPPEQKEAHSVDQALGKPAQANLPGPPSDDPYRLNKRTISYGIDQERQEDNSLFVSGTFGGKKESVDFQAQQQDQSQNLITAASHSLTGNALSLTEIQNQNKMGIHRTNSSQSMIYQLNQANQLGASGQALQGVPLSQNSHSSNTVISAGNRSSSIQSLQEEQKLFVRPHPIEEEASSGSSQEGQQNKMAPIGNNSPDKGDRSQDSERKKSGLMSKVRRGLRKLSIKKDNQTSSSINDKVTQGKGKTMGAGVDTYERNFSKSATMRSPTQPTLVRHTSQLVEMTRGGDQKLYAIEEEHQQLETSQRQTKSCSDKGGVRPTTPDFENPGAQDCDSEHGSDQERDNIRERMEAQIRDFDDEDD